MKKPVIIAIDGPSGSGKSTVGTGLARSLGYDYINSGSLYRALALKALDKGSSKKVWYSIRDHAADARLSRQLAEIEGRSRRLPADRALLPLGISRLDTMLSGGLRRDA